MKGTLVLAVIGIAALIMIMPVSGAQPPGNEPFFIVSGNGGNSSFLSVPLNSSGANVFTNWAITFLENGSYSISYNGSTVMTGYADAGQVVNQSFPAPVGKQFSVSITFRGTSYTFHDIAQDSVSFASTQSVTVVTSYPGENQFLAVSSGQQGVLLYPNWKITIMADFPENFSIMENGGLVKSGTVQGTLAIPLILNSSTVSIQISVGGKVYSFDHEIITSIPIQKYYGPPPPSLEYTLSEYEYGIARAFVASTFAIMISLFTARKYLLEREKREAIRI